MSELVVDASVAVKWFTLEDHSAAAIALLGSDATLHAPAHWLAEVATALWAKCVIRDEISREQLLERTASLVNTSVRITPLQDLLPEAVTLAHFLRATVYDTLYLALALRRGAAVVTADRRFFERAHAAGEPYRSAVRWIAEQAES